MQEENNHISFTADDIRKYHEGKLTPAEMHALEKAALEDPFLADALEGYAVDSVSLPSDTDELKRRLAERLEDKKVIPLAAPPRSFGWLRAAAMIVAIAGAGLLVYKLGFDNKDKNIAQTTVQEKAKPDTATIHPWAAEDSVAKLTTESTTGAQASAVKDSPVNKAADYKDKPATNPVISAAPAQSDQAAPSTLLEEKAAPVVTKSYRPAKEKTDNDTISNEQGLAAIQLDRFQAERTDDLKKQQALGNAAAQQNRARRNMAFMQNNIFRGKVTDSQNNPLPFANITNSRDNVGTYSDAQGNFVLTSPDSVMDVQVRSLGFENNNVQLQNGITSNKVVLKDDRSLTEVVLSNKKINTRLRDGNMVLEEPEPADGWSNYDTYLANNLNIPETYNKPSGGGEVELSFEVNQLGEPVNIKVVRSLCEVCDKEAIRLLKEGPKWKRKAKKGKRTTVTIPF